LFDTIIVGGGPIGSYIAGKLAMHGHKVVVLEKKATAGQEICCTGIISKECHDLLRLNGTVNAMQVNSAVILSPSERPLRLQRKGEVAYVVDRANLDIEVSDYAQNAGAEFRFSTHVTDIEVHSDHVQVKTNGNGQHHFLKARSAVLATGYGSMLSQKLNLGKISTFILGAQAEVQTNDSHDVEIYTNRNLAPGGFAWLVPTSNGKSLAGLITSDNQEDRLNYLLNTLKIKRKISSYDLPNSYGVIPLKPLPRTYSDRVLVVGEAAGQVKPTTGGGIYFGILCGSIAADVVHQAIESNDYSARHLSSYQKQWQKKLGKELMIEYWSHKALAWLNNQQIEYLLSIARKNKIQQSITSMEDFSFDWHSRTLFHIAHSLLPFGNLRKKITRYSIYDFSKSRLVLKSPVKYNRIKK
jgi:digeranylgeranylglycerophospholipid reductase